MQIEIALNILNKALNAQKIKDYKTARTNYDELGRLEIVKSTVSANNPIIDRLKYLHARNRGFLRIHELIHSNLSNNDSIYDEILAAVNDLLNAITYADPDEKTVLLLGALFSHFGHSRLARLCYELKLPSKKDENHTLLLNDSKIIHSFLQLIDSLHVNRSEFHNSLSQALRNSPFTDLVTSLRPKLNWDSILTYKEWDHERNPQFDDDILKLDVDVDAGTVQLDSFWDSWNAAMAKPRGKNKYPDAYAFTEERIRDVHVSFHDSQVVPEVDEPVDDSTRNEEREEEEKFVDALDYVADQAPPAVVSAPPAVVTAPPVRPMRNLRGKTDVVENVDALHDDIKNLDLFVSSILPDVLSHFDVKVDVHPLATAVIEENHKLPDPVEQKFYKILSNWDDDATQSLHIIDNTKNSRVNSINELLNIQQAKIVDYKKFTPVPYSNLRNLLEQLSHSQTHFHLFRTRILEFFTISHENFKFNSIITTVKFSKQALKTFKNLVDSVSISYYKRIKNDLLNNTSSTLSASISISILESLLDSYLEFINDQNLKKSALKTASEITFFETTIQKQLKLWFDLIEDYFTLNNPSSELENYLWIKYKWLHINYVQATPERINSQSLMESLSEMQRLSHGKEYYQPFVNYEFIPVLDEESIENQLSKHKILEIFNQNEKSNEILESILLNTESTYANNDIKLQLTAFMENSDLQMKLRLWSLLLRYYRVNKNLVKYKLSYEKIISILLNQLDNTKSEILNVIGFFTFFTKQFIDLFCESPESVRQLEFHDTDVSKKMVKSAASLLHLFYIVLMHKKLASIDNRPDKLSKSKKSNELLEDAISCCFFLISSYISNNESSKKPELLNDLLSMCHVHLGLRNRCNSLNGNFLYFLQCKLSKLDFSISANDVFQIIHCRFGFPVTIDKFETFDHKCKPMKLDLANAIQLSNYISTYCFRGKHPVQSPPKNDIKNIIDSIIEVVGRSGMDNEDVVANRKLFDTYLNETNIDLKFIIKVFNGEIGLEFTKPKFNGVEVAQSGLFYLQGLVGINFFKVRKRTVQSRVSELEPVSRILKRDIYCGSNRFETWISLGQIYSYVVEDDLIWTADKLNSLEKKQVTALSQKKSLLCYLMAISIYVKADETHKEAYKPVLTSLWECFSKELYNAWMQPMNKKAFHTFQITKLNESNKKMDTIESVSNDIPAVAIFKLLELGFQNATKYDENNWYHYMYLAKSKYKMRNRIGYELPAAEIIELMTKACCLAHEQSNKEDPIIEPHYYRISMIIKLWAQGYISAEQGAELFGKDPLFKDLSDSFVPQNDFVDTVMLVLDKLISYDKKNWQHRPVYRRAKILEEMKHDTAAAKEEMLKMVNLKPSVRSLSTIWKPVYERPGKHFIYNAIYTKFLTSLLYKMGNLYSLIVLLKKIRRAGVVMVNLTKIFDDMTLRICTLIRKSIKLKNGYLEDILTRVSFKDFLKYSPKFIEYMKQRSDFDKKTLLDMFFLSEMQNFRKLATGFGATSLIDEVFHSLYMKMFVPYLYRILVSERNGGLKVSEILVKAREFKLEKVLSEHKSRMTTPDAPQVSGAGQTNPGEPMEIDVWDVDTELSEDDKNCILAYLSFKEIVAHPTKDKIKLARRDISPFAIKMILATTKPVDKLKEDTNDGETIDYDIPQVLSDSELEEVASQLNSKETKENKEEKEFEKLIAEHERTFSDEELHEFNVILQKFDVKEVVKFTPPKEIDLSLEKTNSEGNTNKLERVDETITVIKNKDSTGDSPVSKVVRTLIGHIPHNESEVELAVQSVVENISQATSLVHPEPAAQISDIPEPEDQEKSTALAPNESFGPLLESAVENVATAALEAHDDANKVSLNADESDGIASQDQGGTSNVPDAVVNPVQSAESSFSSSTHETESTKNKTNNETTTGSNSKEPSPKKQSVITSFFKVSPEKNALTKREADDEMKMQGSPEFKKRKLIDTEEDFNRYQQSLDSMSLPGSADKASKLPESVSLRRNSRTQMLHKDLLELSNDGNPRPQRKKKSVSSGDIVEVLSDSDSNSDSVIVID